VRWGGVSFLLLYVKLFLNVRDFFLFDPFFATNHRTQFFHHISASMASHTPKFSRRDQFTRSISDSHAGYIHQSGPKATLSNTSFDDTAVEFSGPKIALMTTSNSMPNLAALNDEPLPDISDWAEFDLPFDLFESYCASNAEVLVPFPHLTIFYANKSCPITVEYLRGRTTSFG
jgi:hypothetical protein